MCSRGNTQEPTLDLSRERWATNRDGHAGLQTSRLCCKQRRRNCKIIMNISLSHSHYPHTTLLHACTHALRNHTHTCILHILACPAHLHTHTHTERERGIEPNVHCLYFFSSRSAFFNADTEVTGAKGGLIHMGGKQGVASKHGRLHIQLKRPTSRLHLCRKTNALHTNHKRCIHIVAT